MSPDHCDYESCDDDAAYTIEIICDSPASEHGGVGPFWTLCKLHYDFVIADLRGATSWSGQSPPTADELASLESTDWYVEFTPDFDVDAKDDDDSEPDEMYC